MKYYKKKYYVSLPAIIILLLLPALANAQELSPLALKIYKAYDNQEQQPHAPILQMEYLNTFPYDADTFMAVFNPHTEDQLTEVGEKYIRRFRELGYDYPDTALKRAMYIGSGMKTWSKGAVAELQKTIFYLTDKNRELFIDILDSMKRDEQEGLARFLYAGVKGDNVNYGFITDVVRLHGNKKLYKIFERIPEEIKKEQEEELKQAQDDNNTDIQTYRRGL